MAEAASLGQMIAHCSHLGRQCMDMRLRQYNVTPVQSQALHFLSMASQDRDINQRDLERILRLRASTVNGVVERLEEKGYITRRPSAADGRCRLISLTAEGRHMVDTFQTALEETERVFCSDLTEAEQREMRRMLSRIIANLENEVNHP